MSKVIWITPKMREEWQHKLHKLKGGKRQNVFLDARISALIRS